MIRNLKSLFKDIIYISRLSKVQNKKARILLSIFLANLTVGFDLLIIVVFSRILSDNSNSQNIYLDFFLNNLYLLPFVIVFRFISIYIEKTNIQLLVLELMESLKEYIIREVYKKGNFSVADASFYSTTLSEHIASFYGHLAQVLNNSNATYCICVIFDLSRFKNGWVFFNLWLIANTAY